MNNQSTPPLQNPLPHDYSCKELISPTNAKTNKVAQDCFEIFVGTFVFFGFLSLAGYILYVVPTVWVLLILGGAIGIYCISTTYNHYHLKRKTQTTSLDSAVRNQNPRLVKAITRKLLKEKIERLDDFYDALNVTIKNHENKIFVPLLKNSKEIKNMEERFPALFVTAIEDNNTEAATLLLKEKIEIKDLKDSNGNGLLATAIKKENEKIINLLLNHGINTEIPDAFNCLPLYLAVKNRDIDMTKLLLKKGAKINPENTPYSPFLAAVKNRDIDMTKLLLKKGANIETTDVFSSNALFTAVENEDIKMVELLLQKGINTEKMDLFSRSSFSFAVEKRNKEIINLLLTYTSKDSIPKMLSPLFLKVVENNDYEMAKFLIEKNINVNYVDPKDWKKYSALHFAVQNRNTEMVSLLLENGADIELLDSSYQSPLCIAVKNKDIDMTKLLLENGAKIHYKAFFYKNVTPLSIAVEEKNREMIKLLLKHKENIHPNTFWDIPLLIAVKNKDLKTLRLLLENGSIIEKAGLFFQKALPIALNNKDTKMIPFLLEQGLPIFSKNSNDSPLAIAVTQKDATLAKFLLKNAFPITNMQQLLYPLLLQAIENNDYEMVSLFLQQNIDINYIDPKHHLKLSAFHLAVKHGNIKIVKLLLENGADIEKVGAYFKSPLYMAVENNNFEMTKFLIENGASTKRKENQARTLVEVAKSNLKMRDFLQKFPG